MVGTFIVYVHRFPQPCVFVCTQKNSSVFLLSDESRPNLLLSSLQIISNCLVLSLVNRIRISCVSGSTNISSSPGFSLEYFPIKNCSAWSRIQVTILCSFDGVPSQLEYT